jgi:hypothetical protein
MKITEPGTSPNGGSRPLPLPAGLTAWAGATALLLAGCGPHDLHLASSTRHPTANQAVTLSAWWDSSVPIDYLRLYAGEYCLIESPDTQVTATINDLHPYSNRRLVFRAEAVQGEHVWSREEWVYVVAPLEHDRPPPTEENSEDGTDVQQNYPSRWCEETASRLFHAATDIVRRYADKAVVEFISYPEVQEQFGDVELTAEFVTTDADLLVEAVAWFVDLHALGGCEDPVEAFERWGDGFGYSVYGSEFAQPADLTLRISELEKNRQIAEGIPPVLLDTEYILGDCEDRAILRAALLRNLGFAPWAITVAQNFGLTHEYNLVIYQGAWRVMGDGPIGAYLADVDLSQHRTCYAWNEDSHSRRAYPCNFLWLTRHADNYPGGKGDGHLWCWKNYSSEIDP